MYSLQRIVEPTAEPVTLYLAKGQCRLDQADTSEDALLTLYIKTAREYCEGQTGRSLVQQTWVLTRDSFPGTWPHGPYWGYSGAGSYCIPSCGATRDRRSTVLLPRGRVLSLVSIKYWDTTNVQQTLDPSQYVADLSSEPARLAPAPGKWWPATTWRTDAVQVTYTAGYGVSAAAVPGSVQMAMLLLVGHWYENREATQAALTGNGPLPLPLGVDALLAPYTDTALTYEA